MNIVFEDYDKKFKSKVLKGIENVNNILKNIYDEVFINHEGIAYSVESKLDTGRVFCKTNIDEFIEIPKGNFAYDLLVMIIDEIMIKNKIISLFSSKEERYIYFLPLAFFVGTMCR